MRIKKAAQWPLHKGTTVGRVTYFAVPSVPPAAPAPPVDELLLAPFVAPDLRFALRCFLLVFLALVVAVSDVPELAAGLADVSEEPEAPVLDGEEPLLRVVELPDPPLDEPPIDEPDVPLVPLAPLVPLVSLLPLDPPIEDPDEPPVPDEPLLPDDLSIVEDEPEEPPVLPEAPLAPLPPVLLVPPEPELCATTRGFEAFCAPPLTSFACARTTDDAEAINTNDSDWSVVFSVMSTSYS